MATKADLIAELALLQGKLTARDAERAKDPPPEPDADPARDPATDADLATWLAGHGFDTGEAKHLLDSLTKELDDLTRDKPLLSAGAAFGVGFLLGRLSK